MTTSVASEIVTLKGGLAVSVDALRVLWDLEDRGFELWLDAGVLCVRPAVSDASDREAVRAHRDELAALVAYCDDLPA